MNRAWLALVSGILLVLSALALDDITTGREDDLFGEISVVAFSVAWFGRLGRGWLRRRTR